MSGTSYFPRGGQNTGSNNPRLPVQADANKTVPRKRKQVAGDDDELFGKKKNLRVGVGKPSAPSRKATKKILELKALKQAAVDPITPLTRKVLVKDSLVLVAVKDVQDDKVVVNLPVSGAIGEIPITAISPAYTELLEDYAQSDGDDLPEELSPLSELFALGDLLPCKVVNLEGDGRQKIMLSCQPSDINSSVDSESLRKGSVLWGAVKSVEEHGYAVDLGLARVNAFLNFKNVSGKLRLGSLVRVCVLSSSEGRVLTLTALPTAVEKHEYDATKKIIFRNLTPGSMVSGKVAQILPSGLLVDFLSVQGSIVWDDVPEPKGSFVQGQEIQCRVLHLQPFTKMTTFSRRPHHMGFDPVTFEGLERGNSLEATITSVSVKGKVGVILSNADGVEFFANRNQISDNGDDETEAIAAMRKLSVNSRVKCRILAFDFLENRVLVSLKQSVLKRQYMNFGDIVTGSFCSAAFYKFCRGGASVSLDGGMKGFVPIMHLSDVPLKNPESRFSEGDRMICRVLKSDSKTRSVTLTCKASLLKKTMSMIESYDEAKLGSITTGFIVSVREKGVLVAFYNDVTGWVPNSELSHERIEYPDKVFFLGQVVKCKVLRCDPENRRMRLTFKLDDVARPFGSKKKRLPDDFKIGKASPCSVLEKTDSGLDVTLKSSGMKAFLPTAHLSDHACLTALLVEALSVVGTEIKDCVYGGHSTFIRVTRKPSFVSAAKAGLIPTSFEDLKPGRCFPGFIRKVVPYGAFVDFGCDLVGLVPNRYMLDTMTKGSKEQPGPQPPLVEGQSVIGAVTEIETEKRRFIASLKMSDCWYGTKESAVELVKMYFDECRLISNHWASLKGVKAALSEYTIGSVREGKVTASNDDGMTLMFKDGVKGFVTFVHTANCHAKEGESVSALILNIDFQYSCVECTVNKKIVTQVQGASIGKPSAANQGQVIKSEMLHINDNFGVALLKGHAAGKVALVPVKRHLNDFLATATSGKFSIGQVNPLIIQERTIGGLPVGCVETDKDRTKKKTAAVVAKLKPVGTKIAAKVTHVHGLQLSLRLSNGQTGRVYITHVCDEVSEGEKPLEKFKVGKSLQVVITGYRLVQQNRYLPVSIDAVGASSAVAECSLRKADLLSLPAADDDSADSIALLKPTIGHKVTGYVSAVDSRKLEVQLSPLERGIVPWWLCSTDNKVLSDLPAHFLVGAVHSLQVVQKTGPTSYKLSVTGEETKVRKSKSSKALITGVVASVGVYVALPNGFMGRAPLGECVDKDPSRVSLEGLKKGDIRECYVFSCSTPQSCVISLRSKADRTEFPTTVRSIKELSEGQTVVGHVTNASEEKGVFISIGAEVSARITPDNSSEYDISKWSEVFPSGLRVTAKVIGIHHKSKHVSCSLLAKDTGLPDSVPKKLRGKKRVLSKATVTSPKKKAVAGTATSPKKKAAAGTDSDAPAAKKRKTKTEPSPPELSDVSSDEEDGEENGDSGFDWGTTLDDLKQKGEQEEKEEGQGPEAEDNEDEGSSKKKKMSAKAVYEKERWLADPDREPETNGDFERLLVQSPDSSMIWLKYMSVVLERGQVDKGRAVGLKALKTISYREEQEKLNVWRALFTLESIHGSEETFDGLLTDALKKADPLSIYQTVASVYSNQGNKEKAEEAHLTIVKRWGQERSNWTNMAEFYYSADMAPSARKLLDRCLKTIPSTEHIETISKFALLEFRRGDRERGKTVFENVLSTCPKRTDLWSQYMDLLIKTDEIEHARQMFEKTIRGDHSAKKMRLYYKKYAEFEEKYGDKQKVEDVKLKAAQYLQLV